MERWDACTLEPNSWLRWIECHPGLAAYGQGAFSVAAVIFAAFVPLWLDRRRSQREKILRTRQFILTLTAAVDLVLSEAGRAEAILKRALAWSPQGEDIRPDFKDVHIRLPAELELDPLAFFNLDADSFRPFNLVHDAVTAFNIRASRIPAGWTLASEEINWKNSLEMATTTLGFVQKTCITAHENINRFRDLASFR